MVLQKHLKIISINAGLMNNLTEIVGGHRKKDKNGENKEEFEKLKQKLEEKANSYIEEHNAYCCKSENPPEEDLEDHRAVEYMVKGISDSIDILAREYGINEYKKQFNMLY